MTAPKTTVGARRVLADTAHGDGGDLAALRCLVGAYVDTWYGPGQAWSVSDQALVADLAAAVATGRVLALLAEAPDSGPVGCALLTVDRSRRAGTVGKMYVAPAHRGGGAADALMAGLFAAAAAEGLAVLELIVARDRIHARRLYARWGFLTVPGAPAGFAALHRPVPFPH